MKKFKNVLVLVLTMCLLLGTVVDTYAATTTATDKLTTQQKAIANIKFEITPTKASHSSSSTEILVHSKKWDMKFQYKHSNGKLENIGYSAQGTKTDKTYSGSLTVTNLSPNGTKFVEKANCTFYARKQSELTSVSKKLTLVVN